MTIGIAILLIDHRSDVITNLDNEMASDFIERDGGTAADAQCRSTLLTQPIPSTRLPARLQ